MFILNKQHLFMNIIKILSFKGKMDESPMLSLDN
jgi:hypothetical protein